MERTKQYFPQPLYPINDEPIVLSKHLLDVLLKETNFASLLALYTFYYYTAKWQKTDQPRATLNYVCKGIGWSDTTVKKIKKQLKELGLIEDVQTREEGKITGHYIKVNFIWVKNTTSDFPTDGEYTPVNNTTPNALNPNSKTVSPKKLSKKEHNQIYLPMAEYLSDIILTKKNMRYTPAQIFSWTNDIRQLVETNHVSEKRIRCVLQWYKKHIGEQYCPVIESGRSLRDKFPNLESAIEREQHTFNKDEITTCPRGFIFGKDFDTYQGCITCEDKHNKTFEQCRISQKNNS